MFVTTGDITPEMRINAEATLGFERAAAVFPTGTVMEVHLRTQLIVVK